MNSDQRFRARVILILTVLGALLLVSALYWIQIVNGETYSAKANIQYARPATSLFDRGTIYFETKDGTRVSAATIVGEYVLYMDPLRLGNPDEAYDALSEFADLDKKDFMDKASEKNERYKILAEKINQTAAENIKKLQLPGIGVALENRRAYPGGNLAAHVLGLVGEDASSSSLSGRYGLERSYEKVLFRKNTDPSANAFAQLFGGLNAVFGSGDMEEGDIVTSIEPSVERYLEKVLGQVDRQWKADEIGGIVMDPQTGKILAMASLPGFDPNNVADAKSVKVLSNPLVEHVYEMGSIMKPLTMAVALDTGAVNANSKYDDTGSLTLSGKKISNYDGKARGWTSMQEILSQSLNVGSATLALKVGKEEFGQYFLNFGLGQKTGIDAPNEAAGLVGNLISGRDIEIATAAYGQGVAVSPINIVRTLSVLANGGYMVQPHFVKKIEYTDGRSTDTPVTREGPFLKPETTEEVTRMLIKVVDDKIAQLHPGIYHKNYSVAAKTGTAQIPDPKNGGYYADRYLHSFFGYFPAYAPKFLVFLYQVNPKGAEYASETLTDPFSDLVNFLLSYYNVPPDR